MNNIITTIAVSKSVTVDCDVATFSLSFNVQDISSQSAELKMQEKVTAVHNALIDILNMYGVSIIDGSMKPSSYIEQKFIWDRMLNKDVEDGFNAYYSASFQINDVKQAHKIYK